MQKNKVILAQLDQLKAAQPDWPWIEALKAAGSSNSGATNSDFILSPRKKLKNKVRVVMSNKKKIEQEGDEMERPSSSTTNAMKAEKGQEKDQQKMKEEMHAPVDNSNMAPNEVKSVSEPNVHMPQDSYGSDMLMSRLGHVSAMSDRDNDINDMENDKKGWYFMENNSGKMTTIPMSSNGKIKPNGMTKPKTTTTSQLPSWFVNAFSSSTTTNIMAVTTARPATTMDYHKEVEIEMDRSTAFPPQASSSTDSMPDYTVIGMKPKLHVNRVVFNGANKYSAAIPIVKVNGPSVKLPQFSVTSEELLMENRQNGNDNEEFDLNFFPQREGILDNRFLIL